MACGSAVAPAPAMGSNEVFLGCLNFGRWGGLGPREVQAIVDEAIDLGVTRFDTAAAYSQGESETLLGGALRGRNTPVVVSTKIFGPVGGKDPEDWRARTLSNMIDDSLRRLDVDRIDLLSIHRLDDGVPIEPVLTAMADAKADGRVGALGVSSMSGDLLLEALTVAEFLGIDVSMEQCKLSVLDRNSEASVVPVAERNGIRLSHYGVLDEGLLAGGANNRRYERAIEAQPWPAAARRSLAEKRGVVHQLERLAVEFGLSLMELAVGFAARPASADHASPLPALILGVGRVGQLPGLVSGVGRQLPNELRIAIDELIPPGTGVGVPDRSRIRAAALRRSGGEIPPLRAGDPSIGHRPDA